MSSTCSHYFPWALNLSSTLVALVPSVWCLVSGVVWCQTPVPSHHPSQAGCDWRSALTYAPSSQFTRPSHIKHAVACDPVSDGAISLKTKSNKPTKTSEWRLNHDPLNLIKTSHLNSLGPENISSSGVDHLILCVMPKRKRLSFVWFLNWKCPNKKDLPSFGV